MLEVILMKVQFMVATRRPDSSISNEIVIPNEDIQGMTDQEVMAYIESMFEQWLKLHVVKEWRIISKTRDE
jgi:hypothetical protein